MSPSPTVDLSAVWGPRWRGEGTLPPKFFKPDTTSEVLQGGANIRNRIRWQGVTHTPAQLRTLVRFPIYRGALPSSGRKKEINALIVRPPVHDTNDSEVRREECDSHFFLCFPDGGLGYALSALKVASNDTIVPIFIPGIGPTEEQHLIGTKQENVYCHRKFRMHDVHSVV